jgi:hypothetical protein
MNAARRLELKLCHNASTVPVPANVTLPCSAQAPGCRRMNVLTPMRCKTAACVCPISISGASPPFSVVSTGGSRCHTPF